jgi:hypothetical protein
MIDDEGRILPLRFRQGEQFARLVWAHEFRGEAVSLADMDAASQPQPTTAALAERQVKTLPR